MQHASYRQFFPATIIAGKNTEAELETAHGGFRYATSVGGTLTGRGGNVIVIDDPMKPDEAMSAAARERVWERCRSICWVADIQKRTAIRTHYEPMQRPLRLARRRLGSNKGYQGLDCSFTIPEALMLDLSASSVLHLARSEHNRRRVRLRPQARAR